MNTTQCRCCKKEIKEGQIVTLLEVEWGTTKGQRYSVFCKEAPEGVGYDGKPGTVVGSATFGKTCARKVLAYGLPR
jgi:hypothetical protein